MRSKNKKVISRILYAVTVGIPAILWFAIFALMIEPVADLYGRGHGRASSIIFLLVMPLFVSLLAIVWPVWLRKRGETLKAVLVSIVLTISWALYAAYLIIGMAI